MTIHYSPEMCAKHDPPKKFQYSMLVHYKKSYLEMRSQLVPTILCN